MKKQAVNPVLPIDEYIPDAEPHVFGDRVYLYGSHDKEDGDTFCMLDYRVWSAPVKDLSDWTNKGFNYSSKQDPFYREDNSYMYAPDCVKGNDGRYYLYYCLSGEKGKGGYSNPISIAVCDTPDGRFEYYGYVQNKDGSPYMKHLNFDPAVINDDGVIRLYSGSNLFWLDMIPLKFLRNKILAKIAGRRKEDITEDFMGSFHMELEDDMKTIRTEAVRIDDRIKGDGYKEHRFFEGSSIRKINDTYCFIYSSIRNHELCYATSKYPDRDFEFRGTIVSNGDIGYEGRKDKDRLNHTGTNHGSIEYINGNWYVFYHRLTHNSDYSRQVCAEKIEMRPDGNIPQVPITSCGLNDGPLKEGSYPAVICCNLSNGKMSHGSNSKNKTKEPHISSGNNERFIKDIDNGTRIAYKYFALKGNSEILLTVRGGKGRFDLSVNAEAKAYVDFESGNEWTKVSMRFDVEEGVYTIALVYEGNDSVDLKDIEIRKI